MNWEEDRTLIVKTYYECVNNNQELCSILKNNTVRCQQFSPIAIFILDRLSAVWYLTINNMLWDADIIDRSVLESLIKLMFMLEALPMKRGT